MLDAIDIIAIITCAVGFYALGMIHGAGRERGRWIKKSTADPQ